MARNWTPAQKSAIDAENADILVAAAAGSGKTAVLVERIIRKITNEDNPVDIDRLLVVTFTKAAAAEMRQRIGDALSEKMEQEPANELLSRQLALLPRASITTIHAFCHKILRANFHLLGLDPSFRIADETEDKLLRLAALEEVIEEMYEDPVYAEDFLHLTEAYLQIKNMDDFYKMLERIYDFSMSLPNPEQWLKNAAAQFVLSEETDFDQSPFVRGLLEAAKDLARSIIKKYDVMITMADNDDGGENLKLQLVEEQQQFLRLLSVDTYEEMRHMVEAFAFDQAKGATKGSQPIYRQEILDMRSDMKKKEVKRFSAELFPYDAAQQREFLGELAPLMNCLSCVVMRLRLRFDEKKEAKNILNYNDLEHGCYQLFVDEEGNSTDLAESVKNQFDEIMIDEYQDTSALQEAIFAAIKKEGGIFMVGDMKQSIYRFRNTDPRLFQAKKERHREEETAPERKIILSKNFRSRAGALACINFIFAHLMSKKVGDITYNEEEMLYPGLEYPEMSNPLPKGMELCLVELGNRGEDSEDLEKIELEAMFAAKKIQELMEGNYQVADGGNVRSLRYRDICILLRVPKNVADIYSKTLSDFGIPCYSDVGSSFLQSEEITVMLSLLKIIDNPHQDIPLLCVLRSQLYALSPDELTQIRLADRKSDFFDALKKRAEEDDDLGARLREFLDNLNLYRDKSRQLSMAELVWFLYMQTGFYEAQATLPGGSLRRLNLRLLYTRASDFESTGLKGLYSFVRFIDEFQSMGGDYDGARSIGEEQDVVRIMSIHKSKGLEFPVVLLGNVDRKFNTKALAAKVVVHSELGYGPQYVDSDFGLTYQNVARSAVRAAVKRDDMSEELRILYVALTRAREKLILLGTGEDLEKKMESFKMLGGGDAVTISGTSFLDWMFAALSQSPDKRVLENLRNRENVPEEEARPQFYIDVQYADDLAGMGKEETADVAEEASEEMDLSGLLWDISYAHEAETHLPAKVTVSEVKRRAQETEPDSLYLYPRPAFLMEKSGKLTMAEIGTATHSVMECLDYARCGNLDAIKAQIAEMVASGRLTGQEAESVSAEKISAFMNSAIGERLKQAEKVLREVSFGIRVDAEELLHQKGQVMLQGIIDCVIFEADGISILDYKTDRGATPEEIAERYGIQLDCYAKAAEKLYQKPVRHRYLYLFHYDCLMEV